MTLSALLTAAALTVPAPYQVQETQPRASSTVILAAYVSPDAVGHSLLVVRDRAGKTLWKRNLGWKYHLEAGGGNTVTVRTLLPDGQTWARTFNAQTGAPLGDRRFVDLTDFSPLVTPAPAKP